MVGASNGLFAPWPDDAAIQDLLPSHLATPASRPDATAWQAPAFDTAEAKMSNHHFVVSQRDTSWQFSFRGEVTAPFSTRREAVEEAIREAKETGLNDIAVVVQDADLKTETVWQPDIER